MIPLTDLRRQHEELAESIEAGVLKVLRSQRLILGEYVERFEDEVRTFLGAEDAVGVSSGSDGLVLSLLDAGIGPGDEVITTPLTFVATAEAICRVGATPVFADVEPEQLSLTKETIERALSERTRAVIIVHLFGHVGPLQEVADYCRALGLVLIEDAAQAFGARVGARAVGTFGDYGVFSFFPAKVLGGAGDAGLVVSAAERGGRLRQLRVHGHVGGGEFAQVSGNYRLDAIQAAVLSAKLPHVPRFLSERRAHAGAYEQGLAQLKSSLELPRERSGTTSAWNYYVVRASNAPELIFGLKERGIATTGYYWTPLHRQRCFAGRARATSLDISEQVAPKLVALPLFPELTPEEREAVIRGVSGLVEETSA